MATYGGLHYRLRASSPIPTAESRSFVLHTFMAEVHETEIDTCTSSLPSSTNFKGQGGRLVSASYSRLPLKGGDFFRGQESSSTMYVEEDGYGGAG